MKKNVFLFAVSLIFILFFSCKTEDNLLNEKEKAELTSVLSKLTGANTDQIVISKVENKNSYKKITFLEPDGKNTIVFLNHDSDDIIALWSSDELNDEIMDKKNNLEILSRNDLKYVVGKDANSLEVFEINKEVEKRASQNNMKEAQLQRIIYHPYPKNPVLEIIYGNEDSETNLMIGYNLVSHKAVSISCHGKECCKIRYYPDGNYYECACQGCVMQNE